MTRNQKLAKELMHGCPEESREDHQAVADALRRGDSASHILGMRELNDWPETYVWLKGELSEK